MGNNGDCNDKDTFSCPRCNGKFSNKEYFFFCKNTENNGNGVDCHMVPDGEKHGLFNRMDAARALSDLEECKCTKSNK